MQSSGTNEKKSPYYLNVIVLKTMKISTNDNKVHSSERKLDQRNIKMLRDF